MWKLKRKEREKKGPNIPYSNKRGFLGGGGEGV